MSSNQWKAFQSLTNCGMTQDPAILDYKSINLQKISSVTSNHQSSYNYRMPGSSLTNNDSYNGYQLSSPTDRLPPYSPFPSSISSFSSSPFSGNQSSSMSSSSSVINDIAPNSRSSLSSSRFPIGTFTLDSISSHPSGDGTISPPSPPSSMNNGIGFFSSNTSTSHQSNSTSSSNSNSFDQNSNQASRETGIIEKLLHSYGFIQCCDRQARLFFHFSQFTGTIEHLKIGDPVEFEMTYDRRTGKPIASAVTKIAPEVVLSEERVTGTVTTELRSEGAGDALGRISYENRGECFFLPYTKDDVEGNVTLHSGDKVSFQIATNQRGNLSACHIRFENPVHPVKYQGVVCSMKENFGFIERADVVKEIFFHFSEAKTKEELRLGDDVEFIIQTRNGKEVACNITKLPPGTVIFEDVAPEIFKGQVLKPLERGPNVSNKEPLPGRLRYRAPDHSEQEVPFGEKDQRGDFTMRHGDWVKFKIATDRRDQLRRATNISLLDESFHVSGEKRELGVVCDLMKANNDPTQIIITGAHAGLYGLLQCVDREQRVYFSYSEVLDILDHDVNIGDEFEFTVRQEPSVAPVSQNGYRLQATRMKRLPYKTVKFEMLIDGNLNGVVIKESVNNNGSSWPPKSPTKKMNGNAMQNGYGLDTMGLLGMSALGTTTQNNSSNISSSNLNSFGATQHVPNLPPPPTMEPGLISYELNGMKKTIAFYLKHCDSTSVSSPRIGDKVDFNISQVKRNREFIATDVKVKLTTPPPSMQRTSFSINSPSQPTGSINMVNKMGNGFSTSNGGATSNPSNNAALSYVNRNNPSEVHQGFIAALKDAFGFIETLEHNCEVFFHFSNFEGDPTQLELGQEVEYTLTSSLNSSRGSCSSAENVKLLPKGTIKMASVGSEVYDGTVVRPLRSVNPDQGEYAGLIQVVGDGPEVKGPEYEFGIMGLANKRELLQVGDPVQLQVDAQGRAANVVAVRKKRRATVDAIKGPFGFLSYEVDEGKKLFFHMSEVRDNANLQPGDQVEFVLVTNQRNGKSSACNVTKIGSNEVQTRPERLISKLRTVSVDDNGPKLTVIRQPKGTDNIKTLGFTHYVRRPRLPGVLLSGME